MPTAVSTAPLGPSGTLRVSRLMAPPTVLGPWRVAAAPLNTSTPTMRVTIGK